MKGFMITKASKAKTRRLVGLTVATAMLLTIQDMSAQNSDRLDRDRTAEIQDLQKDPESLAKLFPIVGCSFIPSRYERILLTQIRDYRTTKASFKAASEKIATILVNKAVQCLNTLPKLVETPVATCFGEELKTDIEFVSIMRSGDALLETFLNHFPESSVSKILIQRDEETAEPHFKYMKLSSTIASSNSVIITEPMLATGGTLEMAISLLKEKGVREENIIVASIVATPEALTRLNAKFPQIKVVLTVLDNGLNEKKYIVPGLGDFGDRYYGT